MIAALFVQARGVYAGRPDVDPWDEARDARDYDGPWPVVAHPPCGPWGRYSKPTPESTARGPLRGDDDGCFLAALASVRRWGGVLEHPRDSAAWAHFGLTKPTPGGGWTPALFGRGWTCEVDQGHYGHAASKRTWLYAVSYYDGPPAPLVWGPSTVAPIGTGARRGNLESLSKIKRAATPPAFADLLIAIAESAR